MYRILVVDDEPRQRKGLIATIQGNNNEYEIFEAKNGIQAKDIISSGCIDILITDIEMPGMNGIELIKYTFEHHIKIKTIIISAYSEFEYAQQALKMGVSDYVIKPVTKDNLRQSIFNVISRLEHERQAAIRKENMDIAYSKYNSQLLNLWLRGVEVPEDDYGIRDQLPDSAGCIVIAQYNILNDHICSSTLVAQAIMLYLEKECSILFCEDNISKNRFLMICSGRKPGFHIKDAHQFLKQVIEDLKPGAEINFGVSAYIENIRESPKNALKQAEDALRYQFFVNETITYFDDICVMDYSYYNRLDEENEIIRAIQSNDKEKVIYGVNSLLTRFYQPGRACFLNTKEVMLQIVKNIILEINNRVLNKSLILEKAENTILTCRNFQNLGGETINIILELMHEYHAYKENSNQNLLKMICAFIEDNYAKDISLEEISDLFFISAPYFSKVFKSMYGMNYSKYILYIRMKKAKDLLAHTHIKIYEIGNEVGYKDVKYFNRVFKKEMGISPNEYRRLCIEGIVEANQK